MRNIRFSAVVVVLSLTMTAMVPATTTADSGTSSQKVSQPVETPQGQNPDDVLGRYGVMSDTAVSGAIAADQSSGMTARGRCDHIGNSDSPHRSTRDYQNYDVSVHGWWERTGGDCPEKALVWVELQGWYCITYTDMSRSCYWRTVNRSTTDLVRENGRSGHWANARKACRSNSSTVAFRAIVDVDIPGESDPATKFISDPVRVYCYPKD